MVYRVNDNKIVVGVGDLKITEAPNTIETILGSCVGVVLYDSIMRVGGLIHVMLPVCMIKNDNLSKYADTGIPLLVDLMKKRTKSDRKTLTAKIFGGAKMLNTSSNLFNIGMSNEAKTREVLRNMGIRIVAGRIGGTKSHRISLNTETGIVQSKILGGSEEKY